MAWLGLPFVLFRHCGNPEPGLPRLAKHPDTFGMYQDRIVELAPEAPEFIEIHA
jgi:hypothetical protein